MIFSECAASSAEYARGHETMQKNFLAGLLSLFFLCAAVAYFLAYLKNRDNSFTRAFNKLHRRTNKLLWGNTRGVKLLYAIVMLIIGCALMVFALSSE